MTIKELFRLMTDDGDDYESMFVTLFGTITIGLLYVLMYVIVGK